MNLSRITLVKQMLAVRKQLGAAQSERDKDGCTHRCDGLDRQIDALVYDLSPKSKSWKECRNEN